MLETILEKYPYADETLLDQVRVLFVHTSAKDDSIRLWVMRPQSQDTILSFERVAKCAVPSSEDDRESLRDLLTFFWLVEELLEQSARSINRLHESHQVSVWEYDPARRRLPSATDAFRT